MFNLISSFASIIALNLKIKTFIVAFQTPSNPHPRYRYRSNEDEWRE